MQVKLIWATPNIDEQLVYMARVSNPSNQANSETGAKLIRYLIDHEHWSPFDMVNVCFEVETERDIGRQILRHWSIKVQEFSQRYADATQLPVGTIRPLRLQGVTNRQSSTPIGPEDSEYDELYNWWQQAQYDILRTTSEVYRQAIANGVAKELARSVLPEGLTPTRLYLNGSIRSWIHYIRQRYSPHAQAEHRLIAEIIRADLACLAPQTAEAAGWL